MTTKKTTKSTRPVKSVKFISKDQIHKDRVLNLEKQLKEANKEIDSLLTELRDSADVTLDLNYRNQRLAELLNRSWLGYWVVAAVTAVISTVGTALLIHLI